MDNSILILATFCHDYTTTTVMITIKLEVPPLHGRITSEIGCNRVTKCMWGDVVTWRKVVQSAVNEVDEGHDQFSHVTYG